MLNRYLLMTSTGPRPESFETKKEAIDEAERLCNTGQYTHVIVVEQVAHVSHIAMTPSELSYTHTSLYM